MELSINRMKNLSDDTLVSIRYDWVRFNPIRKKIWIEKMRIKRKLANTESLLRCYVAEKQQVVVYAKAGRVERIVGFAAEIGGRWGYVLATKKETF